MLSLVTVWTLTGVGHCLIDMDRWMVNRCAEEQFQSFSHIFLICLAKEKRLHIKTARVQPQAMARLVGRRCRHHPHQQQQQQQLVSQEQPAAGE